MNTLSNWRFYYSFLFSRFNSIKLNPIKTLSRFLICPNFCEENHYLSPIFKRQILERLSNNVLIWIKFWPFNFTIGDYIIILTFIFFLKLIDEILLWGAEMFSCMNKYPSRINPLKRGYFYILGTWLDNTEPRFNLFFRSRNVYICLRIFFLQIFYYDVRNIFQACQVDG